MRRLPPCVERPSVVALIVAGRLAWARVRTLARKGHPRTEIDALVRAGLVAVWSVDDGHGFLVVTLTPHGAEALGVTIVEEGRDDHPRWARVDAPVRPDRIRRDKFGRSPERRLRLPEEFVPAPPGPELLLDEDGEPVKVCGVKVTIDRRLGRRRRTCAEA